MTAAKPKSKPADKKAPRTAPVKPVKDKRVYSDDPTGDPDATPANDPSPAVEPVPTHGEKRSSGSGYKQALEEIASGQVVSPGKLIARAQRALDEGK